MDITFLVGNGFDLSLDYKTSYENFYRYYDWASKDPVHQQAIDCLKASIKKDIEKNNKLKKESNWADFEIGLGIFTNVFKGSPEEFIAVYKDASKHLCKYLKDVENQGIGLNTITEPQWDEIRKNLYSFFQETNDRDNGFFSRLMLEEQSRGSFGVFRFISFNYTNFLDKCIAKIAQKPLKVIKTTSGEKMHVVHKEVLHIHGALMDCPIIGVSDEEQIRNPDFRTNEQLRTTMIKPNEIDEIGSTTYSKMNDIIDHSRIICLWGVSLGESDKHWWTKINKWLKDDQSRHLFIFVYLDPPPVTDNIVDIFQTKRDVINRFLRYSSYSENEKQSLMKRIHPIYNTRKVLVFPKIEKPFAIPAYRELPGEPDNVQ